MVIVILVGMAACGKNSSVRFKQYYVHGQQLYTKHCSNCHQVDGSGLRRVYPPLNTSDYMEKHFDEVVCMIRYGKSGEMFVNGKEYNHAMYGVSSLTDIEVAEITTYIYNTWTHERGLLEVKDASAILAACSIPEKK
jgi:mono/diheme cytochrome c family protein